MLFLLLKCAFRAVFSFHDRVRYGFQKWIAGVPRRNVIHEYFTSNRLRERTMQFSHYTAEYRHEGQRLLCKDTTLRIVQAYI